MENNSPQKHIVIIGAGFAGLWAVRIFFNKPVRVTAGYLCSSYMLASTCWSLISPVSEEAREYRLSLNLPEG